MKKSPSRIVPLLLGVGLVVSLACPACRRAETPAASAVSPTPDPAMVAQTLARATNGDPAAQLQAGLWCLDETGPGRDPRRGAEWLRLAAQAGQAEAQYRLGTLYQAGRGVPRDFTNAVAWFHKAAAQQHVAALFNLGSMSEAGQGVPRDTKTAAAFFQKAAELGDPYAQYNLARRCETGHGVTQNLVQAWKWYDLADAGGVPDTLHARQAIAARLTAEELRAAKQAAAIFRQARSAAPPTR